MNNIEFNYNLKKLNNSDKSLEFIYNYYFGRIVIYITKKYDGGNNISQDVAQEFFRYIYNLKNKPYVNNPTAWVYKCCDHIALKMLKIDRKYNEIDETLVAADVIVEDTVYGDLEEYVTQLDEVTQKIIQMIYVDGYNAKETAEILNMKYGTVRQKHNRGINKIKKLQKCNKTDKIVSLCSKRGDIK